MKTVLPRLVLPLIRNILVIDLFLLILIALYTWMNALYHTKMLGLLFIVSSFFIGVIGLLSLISVPRVQTTREVNFFDIIVHSAIDIEAKVKEVKQSWFIKSKVLWPISLVILAAINIAFGWWLWERDAWLWQIFR
jgi:hypothetical protein